MASAITVSDAKAIIDQIVQLLHRRPYFTVNEVIKGGSLGHGTAVPGKFDVDLVLYSGSISESDMLDPTAATELSQNMDRFLRQNLRGYQLGEIKEHALSFTVFFGQRGCQEVKIDLLLSPYYANQKTLLDNLSRYKSAVERQRNHDLWKTIVQTFSASFSKWQVEFIEGFPNQIKELIKRAKEWRNEQWPDHLPNSGRPKSYLMAVLVISACCDYKEELGCRSYDDMVKRVSMDTLARRVAAIMRADVQNHRRFQLLQTELELLGETKQTLSTVLSFVYSYAIHIVSWDQQLEEYRSAMVPQGQPYILDPANPFNNMYLSGVGPYQPGRHFCEYAPGNGKWEPFAQKVHSLDLRA